MDLEAFYATLTSGARPLSASSISVLHAVVHRALKTAVRDKLVSANVAAAVDERPRKSKDAGLDARRHCWSADEARAALKAAKEAGTQAEAFFTLAIDTGARRSELLGLVWSDVDLDAGTLTIARQLEGDDVPPRWAPTKTARALALGDEARALLRRHRKEQRELRMANANAYEHHDLVFAKQPEHLTTPAARLGHPCPALVRGAFKAVTRAAGVPTIKFHGLRHTCATLLLAAGVPVQVVAQRLGHAQVSMTLEVYAHALPDMQRDAAARLGALLREVR
jgi:integrase